MKSLVETAAIAALILLSACDPGAAANNTVGIEVIEEAAASNVSETVYCEAVEQSVPAEDCAELTRQDAAVHRGAAAFNVPDPMSRGETVEVHLVIDRRPARLIRRIEAGPTSQDLNTMEDLPISNDSMGNASSADPAGIEDDEPAPTPGQVVDTLEGRPERFYPPVGRNMRTELVGQGFDIVPKTELSQQIRLGGQATWIWEVTARQGGQRSLTVFTMVEGVVNGRRLVLDRTPKVRTVRVDVSTRDRLWDALAAAPAWIKLLTTIVAAFGGLLAAWYALPWWKRRRAKKGELPDQADADRSS